VTLPRSTQTSAQVKRIAINHAGEKTKH
jgi:hypothetical protein